ncbi:sugar nucleotide-binding protein, partial [candidate division KSB3 bacterium]|nr:sugar nucleotide-binding protein [candidate division KSB3 bacterium]MBD3326070.1 sugar nucleotide-binding protein [candidate division KSB3 bacterium]
MKILILGGSGMLGHMLWRVLARQFDTYITLRQRIQASTHYTLFDPNYTLEHISIESMDSVIRAIASVQPDIVINGIGVIKQSPAAQDPLTSISINALFPHRLAQICRAAQSRLIHVSTDCVFSGRQGHYTEEDFPDPIDLYGRTKLLGEITYPGCLTLRTSMIGRELSTQHGLIEWFLSQRGKAIQGYTRAIYSGLTTQALAELLGKIIAEFPDLDGL